MVGKKSRPVAAFRQFALQLPEAEEGDSCNKAAFRARKKAFLYIGGDDESFNLMLKLVESLDAAAGIQEATPDNVSVGKGGWTKVQFDSADDVPVEMICAWIEESYRALAPKELAGQVEANSAAQPKQTKKKPASRKIAPQKGARTKKAAPKKTVKKKPATAKQTKKKKTAKKKTANKRKAKRKTWPRPKR